MNTKHQTIFQLYGRLVGRPLWSNNENIYLLLGGAVKRMELGEFMSILSKIEKSSSKTKEINLKIFFFVK